MAIDQTTVTGPILDTEGAAYSGVALRFVPRAPMGDVGEGATLADTPVSVTPDASGDFSVDLAPNAGIPYDVYLEAGLQRYPLGGILVPDTGPVALQALLDDFAEPVEPIPTVTQLVAALAEAEADADRAEAAEAAAAASQSAAAASASAASSSASASSDSADASAASAISASDEADRAEAARDEIKATRQFWDTDYIAAAQIALIRAGDYDAQDEDIVTAGLQAMHDDMMAFVAADRAANGGESFLSAVAQYSGVYAVCDEIFSEDFADKLYNFGFTRCRFEFDGVSHATFKLKNWPGRARVRTGGFEGEAGITGKVPMAVFRWHQKNEFNLGPFVRNIRIVGENLVTDPMGFQVVNTNGAYWDNVTVGSLKNVGRYQEAIVNGGENNMAVTNCGYQPTQFGGPDGLIPDDVLFATVAGSGTTTVTASASIFTDNHVGLSLMVRGAGSGGGLFRGVIQSRTNGTTVVLDKECSVDVTGERASFAPLIGASTAGSPVISVPQFPTGVDLVGSYAMVVGAGGVRDIQNILVSRILSYTGNSVTLADNARFTNSDCRVVISPSEFIGASSDVGNENPNTANNDYQVFATRNENAQRRGDNPSASVNLIVQGARNFDYSFGKLHGTSGNRNNFAGNFAAVIADGCPFLRMPNMQFEWGCYDETYATVSAIGGSTILSAHDMVIGSGNTHPDAALIFIDPQSANNADMKVFYSGRIAALENEAFTEFRFGANGQQDMLFRSGPWVQRSTETKQWADEGVWTPVLSDAPDGGGNDASVGVAKGFYSRQGNLVTVSATITNIDTTGLTAGNTAFVRGLPFDVPFVSGGQPFTGSVVTNQITFSGFLAARGASNAPAFKLHDVRSGLSDQEVKVSDISSGNSDISTTFSYFTAGYDAKPPS